MTTETADDGTFSLAGIRPPGFYLLTFARAGLPDPAVHRERRDPGRRRPDEGANSIAGQGRCPGRSTVADGPIGAATVTITDGKVSLQTSTVSRGGRRARRDVERHRPVHPGHLPGLGRQPRVTAPHPSLVTARRRRDGDHRPDAGHRRRRDHRAGLRARSARPARRARRRSRCAVTGQSGDVTTTRTATTVTSGPVGRFTLPDLPTPGEYTLTVSGAGYQDQVRQVTPGRGGRGGRSGHHPDQGRRGGQRHRLRRPGHERPAGRGRPGRRRADPDRPGTVP